MDLGFLPAGLEPYDVLVIGGGPAGATAALYTARAGLRTLVVDKGLTAGALGTTAKIVNYPGVPGPLSGAELVRRIRDQAVSFGAEFVTDKVLRVDLRGDPKQVWGGEGVYPAQAVVIATGAMGRTRRIPGEERLLGRGVSYCATCDGPFFQGQEVAVVGNNDEAVEEALTLTRFASRVHFLSPTADLRASPELGEALAAHPQVTLYPTARVREVVGQERVEGVRISHQGEERTIPVGGVFVYLQGNIPVTDFLDDQLPVGQGGCLLVDDSFQTVIPGVFAVGDVLCRHLKQAVVAAADGVVAAMAVDRYLSGRKKLRPDWSR
ncbi:MAG TPA: FAD-binding protein [Anaerolineales bacterium]|nr:FAD-binding protein [Anaerolineae bacterium]HIQ01601.1 FAD-binding protein [Anaerolineales bacterium]